MEKPDGEGILATLCLAFANKKRALGVGIAQHGGGLRAAQFTKKPRLGIDTHAFDVISW